jgi:hypothetical protein
MSDQTKWKGHAADISDVRNALKNLVLMAPKNISMT